MCGKLEKKILTAVKIINYLLLFLEGIITFISPCLLPMLPIYISYFAGSSGSKRGAFKNSLAFVAGFTTVFILLGAFATTLGGFLVRHKTVLNIISGGLIIVFGMAMLLKVDFNKIFKTNFNIKLDYLNMNLFTSYIFGVVFSISWTPCVGVFLTSALAVAATQKTMLKGILMLFSYSMGLGIPFVASAVLLDKLQTAFNFIKRNYKAFNAFSGIFLVLMGLFIATGYFDNLLGFLSNL